MSPEVLRRKLQKKKKRKERKACSKCGSDQYVSCWKTCCDVVKVCKVCGAVHHLTLNLGKSCDEAAGKALGEYIKENTITHDFFGGRVIPLPPEGRLKFPKG